jgi:nitronate monooxygenase
MRTRLTESFGIHHPILCAPMALVTGGQLAAAVSRAGGLGIVGGGYAGALGGEPDLRSEIARIEGLKFGVGFITWALSKAPRALDEALEHSPSCLFLSFGDPRPFAESIRRAGARLVCQVQCLRHVDEALEAGADVVVAQGTEAGGHGARRSTLPFVPEVADHLARHSQDTLLLAAGGIADGRGLAAAMMLGADGVVVGSRFWSSREALTPTKATDRAATATGDDTVRTKAIDALRGTPWPPEFSFRVVENDFTREWAHREKEAAAAFGSLAARFSEARSSQNFDLSPIVAGEAVGLFGDRPAAAAIVETMVSDAEAILKNAAALDFTRQRRSGSKTG